MRKISLALALFAIMLILPQNSSAVDYTTTTSLSIPSNITAGQSFDAGIQVDYIDGTAFVGTLSIYHLTQHLRLGGHSAYVSVSNPSIIFTLESGISANVIQVPFGTISGSGRIHYELKSGGSTIQAGSISQKEVNTMISHNSIYIAFGSIQNLWSTNTQILNSDTLYNLTLFRTESTLDMTIPISNVYDGSRIYTEGIEVPSSYPTIAFHSGSVWDESYSGGIQSIQIDAGSSPSLLLAYYGDPFAVFTASMDVMAISPTSVANQLTLYNSSSLVSTPFSISANLNPIESGRSVNFYVYMDNYYHLLGSTITDGGGSATISASFDSSGVYTIYAHTASGTYLSNSGIVNITKHPMVLTNLVATGSYNDLGQGNTTINISGKATTQSGTGLSGITIELLSSGISLESKTSNAQGIFSFSRVLNLDPGNFDNYFQIITNSLNYESQDEFLDLVISKANPTINYTINSPNYGDNLVITGNITNNANELLNLQIFLDEFKSGSWQYVQNQTGPTFEFMILDKNVGTYLYRLRLNESTYYTSKITSFNAEINPASSSLDRLGLPTAIITNYHDTIDLSIYYLDASLNTIDGGTVEVYVFNTDTNNQEFLTSVNTVGGLATIFWTPLDQHLGVGYFELPIMYYASHPNYGDTNLQITVEFHSIQLIASMDLTSYGYGETHTIMIDTEDQYGFKGTQGTEIEILIEGTQYSSFVDAFGRISFTHTFTSVGISNIDLNLVGSIYPYNGITSTITYTVSKGWYDIITNNVNGIGGESVAFEGNILDNLGNSLSNSVTISAYVYDTQWVLIGSQITSSSFSISYPNQLLKGVYNVEFRITGNTYYQTSIKSIQLNNQFEKSTLTKISAPSSYLVFADASERLIEIQLTNFFNSPIDAEIINYSINTVTPITGTLITDITGKIRYNLPEYLTPGTYTISFNFTGSSDFTSSTLTHQFQVNGLETQLNWIQQPTDTYQGEYIEIQVQVSDIYGTLTNHPVTFTINENNYQVMTDSEGIATLSVIMRENNDNVTITIQADNSGVWQSSELNTSITQLHKQLDFDVTNVQAYFGDQIYLTVTSTWDANYVSNTLVEIYYNTELVYSGSSNNLGIKNISLNLQSLPTGSSYLLTVVVSKLDYLPQTRNVSITVEAMPISTFISVNQGVYNAVTNITLEVNNIYGSYVNAYVTISYYDGTHSYSQTVFVEGYTVLQFLPFASGDFLLQYQTFDYSNQIQSESGSFSINVQPAIPQISYIFSDENGVATIEVTSLDTSDQTLNIPIEILIDENLFTTIIGSQTVELPFGDHSIILRTLSDDVEFTEIKTNLYIQDHVINVEIEDQEVYADIPVIISFQGNGSFNGYSVELKFGNNQEDLMNLSLTTQNGVLSFTIDGIYSSGIYTLEINLDEQGWYNSESIIVYFELLKNSPNLALTPNFLYASQNNTVTISLITGNGYEGINVELHSQDNTFLATGVTNENGDVILTFEYGYIGSTDSLKVLISENPYIIEGEYNLIVPVFISTTIEISASEFTFDTGGTLNISLIDGNGNPMNDAQLLIYFGYYNQSINEYQYILISTALTENGFTSIILPFGPNYEFVTEKNRFRVEYVNSDNYLLDFTEIDIEFQRNELHLNYELEDYGITNTIEIELDLFSQGTQINGELYYELRAGLTVIRSGIVTNHLSIAANLIGTYTLYLRYTDTTNPARYQDFSTTIPLNFIQAQTGIQLDADQKMVGENYSISLFDSRTDLSLSGVTMTVEILGEGIEITEIYIVNTIINIPIELGPGEYSIKITISETSLYSSISMETLLKIKAGKLSITVPSQISVNVSESVVLVLENEPENSTYNVFLDGEMVDVSWDNNQMVIDQNLTPGDYLLEIERTNPFYVDEIVTITITVVPLKLLVKILTENQENGVSIIIQDMQLQTQGFENEFPYEVNLSLIITDLITNEKWELMSSGFIPLNHSTSLNIEILTSIWYSEQQNIVIEFTISDIEDPIDTSNQSNAEITDIVSLESFVGIALICVMGIGVKGKFSSRGKNLG